jgi:hypothetical protein
LPDGSKTIFPLRSSNARRITAVVDSPVMLGRFELNAILPFAFDGRGQMEVDLLCAGRRVVLELDGAQQLADAAACRRDRRKDLLLQENGYRVLRFLAEDVGKELDLVMDTILRSLAHPSARAVMLKE